LLSGEKGIRYEITKGLGYLGSYRVIIVATNEEQIIARRTADALARARP